MERTGTILCPACGAALPADACFCSRCGTAMPQRQTSQRYSIYGYDAAYARRRHTFVTFGALAGRGIAYVLCPMILLFFGEAFLLPSLLLCSAGIVALIVDCCLMRKYYLARQSAVARDAATDTLYYVTLFGAPAVGFDTLTRVAGAAHNLQNARNQSRLAQVDAVIAGEIDRYLRGENRFNIWTGGNVRVIEMRRPFVLRDGGRCTVYGYETAAGRQKQIKLPDCFPGLKEESL